MMSDQDPAIPPTPVSVPLSPPGAAASIEMIVIQPGGVAAMHEDCVPREEPLEIRVADETIAVIMRTPGNDELLALGFLFAEGFISSADDLSSLAHCGRAGARISGNVLSATPASGSRFRWDKLGEERRAMVASSACGACGRLTIEDLLDEMTPVSDGPPLSASLVTTAVESLRQRQPLFALTGGTHGAACHAADGTALASHEDVGRHNAVDKVVGDLLMARHRGDRREAALLAVSGRVGFEIVQKAARARIPVVAGVSAPTSLAIELAERVGITLAGFVRSGRMNVYAHAHRIIGTLARDEALDCRVHSGDRTV